MEENNLPLSGIRVIEFTHMVMVLGSPARQMAPCSASPSSHCATQPRSAISASKSSPVGTPMLAKR